MEAKITTGLYVMALAVECKTNNEEFYTRLSKSLKWLLEPFALEVLMGVEFFHRTTAMKTSWIKYPTEEFLKLLSKESKEILDYHVEPGNPTVTIDMKEFEIRNYSHPAFKELKMAMIVENIMDKAIEKLGMRNNPKLFEKLAFIYLAKQIQHKNAINLNARWWKNIELPIREAYSEEVFKKLWEILSLTKEEDQRISDGNFSFTARELRFAGHTSEELERTLDEAYARAYIQISKLL